MSSRTALIPAILAVALAGGAAGAAPIAPLPGVSELQPTVAVQRRFGWRDHPLMYQGNWNEHQRQWDAIEGRGGRSCARLRSYDPVTNTYRGKNGRRIACR